MPTAPTQRITRTTLGPPPDLTPDVEAMRKVFAETERPLSLQPESLSQGGLTHSRAVADKEGQDASNSEALTHSRHIPDPDNRGPGVTLKEAVSVGNRVLQGSAVKSTAMIEGGRAGFKIANKLTSGLSIANKPGAIAKAGALTIGTIIGGGAGMLFGEDISDELEQFGLTITDINDVRPELRPLAVFSETLGGGLPFIKANIRAGASGFQLPVDLSGKPVVKFVGDIINQTLRRFQRNPFGSALVEGAALTQAATFGFVAEATFPGNAGARFGAELTGGALSTTRSNLTKLLFGGLNRLRKNLTETGRFQNDAQRLSEVLEAGGRDPNAIIAILKDAEALGVKGAEFTPAQVTGDPILAEIQKGLEASDAAFAGSMRGQLRDVVQATVNAIKLLRGNGSVEALKTAAKLRSGLIETNIRINVENARKRMQVAAKGLTPDNQKDMERFSKAQYAIMEDTLERTEAIESVLHEAIKDGPLSASGYKNVLAAYAKSIAQLTQEKRKAIDPLLVSFIENVNKAKAVRIKQEAGVQVAAAVRGQGLKRPFKGVGEQAATLSKQEVEEATEKLSIKELIKQRRSFQSSARSIRKDNNPEKKHNAAIYSALADAALEDLISRGVSGGRKAAGAERTAFDAAIQFSFAKNKILTRGLVGGLDDVGGRGQKLKNPGSFFRLSTATGEEMTDFNFEQMERASRFLIDQGRGKPMDAMQSALVLGFQERSLRLIAARSVIRDKVTNEIIGVDLEKLRAMSDPQNGRYAIVLARFPEARRVIDAAIKAEGNQQVIIDIAKGERNVLAKSAAGEALNAESPVQYVADIFSSTNPTPRFARAALLARTSGPAAEEGLRASAFEAAIGKATGQNGKIDLQALIAGLTQPLRVGTPSVTRLLRQQGLINDSEVALLGKFFTRTNNIMSAAAAKPTGETIESANAALVENTIRGTGSLLGTAFLRKISKFTGLQSGAGPSLIAAKGGSEAARNFFKQMSNLKARALFEGAMRGDPLVPGGERYGLLIGLLEEGLKPKKLQANLLLVNAYLVSLGVRSTEALQGEEDNDNR